MTLRQKQVLDYVNKFIQDKGYSQSLAEIAKHLGVSGPAARGHVQMLIKRNYLTHIPGAARSIQVNNIF